MKKKTIVIIVSIVLLFLIGYLLLVLYLQEAYSVEEENRIYCDDSQRNVDACIELYQPVCASVQVECITAPCDPVQETFSNSCFACMNERVVSYVDGEC